jgi:peptidoglycan-associated lipoprotein
MTTRWLVSTVLVCSMAVGMTGCKGWFGKGKSKGTGLGSEADILPGGGLSGEGVLPERSTFAEGTNVMAGQFDTVRFAFDSAQVDDTERAKVEAVAEYLKGNTSTLVTLEGHCDERGSAEYNVSLGERRALAVRSYLLNLGIDGARVQTKSFGSERPKDPGHDESAWGVNRRVEFVLIKQ